MIKTNNNSIQYRNYNRKSRNRPSSLILTVNKNNCTDESKSDQNQVISRNYSENSLNAGPHNAECLNSDANPKNVTTESPGKIKVDKSSQTSLDLINFSRTFKEPSKDSITISENIQHEIIKVPVRNGSKNNIKHSRNSTANNKRHSDQTHTPSAHKTHVPQYEEDTTISINNILDAINDSMINTDSEDSDDDYNTLVKNYNSNPYYYVRNQNQSLPDNVTKTNRNVLSSTRDTLTKSKSDNTILNNDSTNCSLFTSEDDINISPGNINEQESNKSLNTNSRTPHPEQYNNPFDIFKNTKVLLNTEDHAHNTLEKHRNTKNPHVIDNQFSEHKYQHKVSQETKANSQISTNQSLLDQNKAFLINNNNYIDSNEVKVDGGSKYYCRMLAGDTKTLPRTSSLAPRLSVFRKSKTLTSKKDGKCFEECSEDVSVIDRCDTVHGYPWQWIMNWLLPLLTWLHIGIITSMARKYSNPNSDDYKDNDQREEHLIFEPNVSSEDFKHIKIPIIEAPDERAPQDEGDYPKVYEENQEDSIPPESEEFRAPSGEYEAPEIKLPKSGEVFDEDTYQEIVKSVKIPKIRFSKTEKDSDMPIDPDLQIQDDTPELPPELVDIKIPTSIPKPNVKIKNKSKKKTKNKTKKKQKKKQSFPKQKKIKKPKKAKKVKESIRTRDPDQVKEYSQMIDNSNPKEEVLIITPVKKKKPNPVFFSNEIKPDFHFPTQSRPRPPTRVPVRFYPKLKRKPKRVNVIIQNKNRRPLLITHQNGDVIYWYPSKQHAPRNNKLQCKRTGFSNQCMIIAHKRPPVNVPRIPKTSAYTFTGGTKPPSSYFDNSDKESIYYQVVKNNPKKVSPGGLIKFSQSLFRDDNKETGSFFKEIDDQDDAGIDEPEAENHEDERITDEEVESDRAKTDDEEEDGEEAEEEDENEEQQNNQNEYDEPEARDYHS